MQHSRPIAKVVFAELSASSGHVHIHSYWLGLLGMTGDFLGFVSVIIKCCVDFMYAV